MKFNKKHQQIMKTVFENYNKLVVMEQEEYLERLYIVMKDKGKLTSFNRGDSDFLDFAIEGYLHNLRIRMEEWQEMLNAVRTTRDIADGLVDLNGGPELEPA